MFRKDLTRCCILVNETEEHANVPQLLTDSNDRGIEMATYHSNELNPLQQLISFAQDSREGSVYGLSERAYCPKCNQAQVAA